jgi:hypothetical protein
MLEQPDLDALSPSQLGPQCFYWKEQHFFFALCQPFRQAADRGHNHPHGVDGSFSGKKFRLRGDWGFSLQLVIGSQVASVLNV